LPIISEEHRRRADEKFKKKEDQAREFSAARREYDAATRATSEKTARLRALRLAKEAAVETGREATKRLTGAKSSILAQNSSLRNDVRK
jgi:hypothetical protein